MDKAKGLTRNPLGIIALFISLIYGFACLVLGLAGGQLTSNERIPLVWFLIGFPILILCSFVFLVTKHHNKLYAPSDYKDERNFVKGFESPQVHSEEQRIISIDNIDSVLKWGSVKGLFAIYAAYLSKINNKSFNYVDLESHSNLLTKEYTNGYLVASSAAGLFSVKSQEEPFQVYGMNKKLEENIKNKVYELADFDKKTENSDYLKEQLSAIEKAFE